MSEISLNNNNKRSNTFRDAFLDWDKKKLKRTIQIIFIIELLLFLYLFLINRNPMNWVNVQVGAPGQPQFLFSIYGANEKDFMNKPMAVCVSGNRIYVADTGNQRVQVFDYNGAPLFKFGKDGKKQGEFRFPYGIATDPSGKIYVADLYNGNVSVFTKDGEFLNYFSNSVEIKGPAGLYVDKDRIYVTDVALNQVKVFDLNGQKLFAFGKTGTGKGEFQSPNSVWVNGNSIYVSDTGNDRVQTFNKLGGFLSVLSDKNDTGEALFVNPRGVAVDPRGVVYVVNNLTHQIFGFDNGGNRLWTFGSMGGESEQFFLPNGLFADDQGRLYITDTVNQRVQVYSY